MRRCFSLKTCETIALHAMADETDKLLRDFLEDSRRDRADGISLRAISNRQLEMDASFKESIAEIKGDMRGHSLRIGELEKDNDKVAAEIGNTSKYRMESLSLALAEQRAAASWWKQHMVKVASAVVVSILLAAGGVIFGMLIHK